VYERPGKGQQVVASLMGCVERREQQKLGHDGDGCKPLLSKSGCRGIIAPGWIEDRLVACPTCGNSPQDCSQWPQQG
jgi:hypothetical protein